MDEPKEGATTLKKKAQEKLAVKANPVSVSETVANLEEAQVPVVEATTDVVVVSEPIVNEMVSEVPAEVVTAEVVVETEAAAE